MKKTKLLYFPIFAALIFGCNNQWDDYVKVSDSNLSGSVLGAIEKNKDLSMFYGFLETTGYKEILSGANNYTVFAPVNNALESYKESSDDIKKNIVRNHIAFLTQKNEDLIGTVKMINGKNLNMDNINLTEEEILCSNGILRTASNVVLAKDNIYELINSYKENNQMAAIISSAGYSVMDIDKSVQLGVDKETGKPYYDTVWSYFNPFLDSIAIDNEDASYKMLLLSDDNFITLRDKYAKYMVQVNDDSEKTLTNAFASESLIYDLICNTEENDFISVNGINIDMENASVTDELEASNGSLIIADNVNIRMKNNKIKDVIIQGEDYVSCLESNWVYVRMRDEAMGGRDVMLSGYYNPSKEVTVQTEEGVDSTYTISYKFLYEGTSGTNYSRTVNSYIRYNAYLYSVKYNVFWVTNDDIPSHYAGDVKDPDYDPNVPNQPCTSIYRVIQKLSFAKEGERLSYASGIIDEQTRKSSGRAKIMVGIDPETAGTNKPTLGVNAGIIGLEQPLRWHQTKNVYDSIANPLTAASTRDILNIEKACVMDMMVTNSAWASGASNQANGMIFLDYIRFSPILDDEE